MKKCAVLLSSLIFAIATLNNKSVAQARHTCSTFQVSKSDTIVVGHNLDDYHVFPGMIIVNPRGINKESLAFTDFRKGWKKNKPRKSWTSKYGSITYSIFGHDLIDGGLNEAGLYIGEMTLMQTIYPFDANKPTFQTNFVMQYILDCYATVDEAIESFSNLNIDGTCRWHYFIADKTGNTAIIEFIDGEAVICKGSEMPHKILCNTTYKSDLDSLALYSGFGGKRPIHIEDKENTKRTVRASEILKTYSNNSQKPIIDYSFNLLQSLDLGNNLWQIVCDLSHGRVYFNTHLNRNIKYVDLSSFDFTAENPKYFDIHTDLKGEVASLFQPLTEKTNRKYVRDSWWAIDMGFFANIFIKPFAVWGLGGRMSGYTSEFYSYKKQ